MKIDILTAKLLKKGFSQEKAELYAVELTNAAKTYGINPYEFADEISEDFSFNDLGSFVFNNALRYGYKTGKTTPTKPNTYVARAIIK
jgi:hypothetical protein